MNSTELVESINNLFDFAFNNPLNELRMVDIGQIDVSAIVCIQATVCIYLCNYLIINKL